MDEQLPQPEMIEKEKYLRLAAEFENYRKQEGRRKEDDQWAAKRDSLVMLLDYLDGNEVGFKNASEEMRGQHKDWYEGMLQAYKHVVESLKRLGVERIETRDKPFDPMTMEVIHTVEGEPSHTVQSEHQAGYTLHGKVIRPAKVIIYQ